MTVNKNIKLSCFEIDGVVYGADIMKIKEVIRPMKVSPIHNAPDFVDGIIKLRGLAVTIIDMRVKFGLPKIEDNESTRVIIFRIKRNPMGIKVDKTLKVLDVFTENFKPPPEIEDKEGNHYIEAVVWDSDDSVLVLDLEKALSIKDVACL